MVKNHKTFGRVSKKSRYLLVPNALVMPSFPTKNRLTINQVFSSMKLGKINLCTQLNVYISL